MAAVASRHHHHTGNYATPHKSLPITMPPKTPAANYPSSRVAMSPPELSDSSTTYSSHGSRHSHSAGSYSAGSVYDDSQSSNDDYSCNSQSGIDIMDMLSERMTAAFDPIRMDTSLAKQTQTSGALNAKQRELAELQAQAQRRLKHARANFAEGMQAARETRRDLDYTAKKISSLKSKAERKHPEAYAKASRRQRDEY